MNSEIRSKIGCWAGLYLLAFTIRLLAALAVGINNPPVSDELEFFEPATFLAEGKGYVAVPQQAEDGVARPTAYRMPGPALLLALSFLGFGVKASVARTTCVVFSSLSAPLLYSFTRRFAPERAALLAGAACALYPSWVYYSQSIMSEAFFIPALLSALILTVDSLRTGDARAFFTGSAWGAATLFRPHALPIFVVAALVVALKSSRRTALLMLLGVTILLTPWLVRNLRVFGRPVLLASESGETFLGCNNPYVYRDPTLYGMWLSPMAVPEYRDHLKPIHDEIERSAEQNKMGWAFLKENPEAAPILAFRKLVRWLTPVTGSKGLVRYCVLFSYGPLLILLTYGAFSGVFKRTPALYLSILCSMVFAGISAVYWGTLLRGRLPLEIIWIPWGAIALTRALGWGSHTLQSAVGGRNPSPDEPALSP